MNTRLLIITLFCSSLFAQKKSTTDNYQSQFLDVSPHNSWSLGFGGGLYFVQGDLKSLAERIDDVNYNPSAYLYIEKMFNPVLGLRTTFEYAKVNARSSYDEYFPIHSVDPSFNGNALESKGFKASAGIDFILCISNFWKNQQSRWKWFTKFGIGYQQYNTKLYSSDDDTFLFHSKDIKNSGSIFRNYANSMYYQAGLFFRYKMTKRLDLEFGSTIGINNEDNLDAVISNRNVQDMFLSTQIGLSFKLGKQKDHLIFSEEKLPEKPVNIVSFNIVDSDSDGVIDQLDKEPNTPKGALVYGNGKALNADNDAFIDLYDKCPLVYGKGPDGCPLLEEITNTQNSSERIQIVNLILKDVYFENNSNEISTGYFETLNNIATLLKTLPEHIISIEGHTDNKGEENYNVLLSEERANAVKNYFIETGIPEEQLKVVGHGENKPIRSNKTLIGREQNRRVEIRVMDKKDLEY